MHPVMKKSRRADRIQCRVDCLLFHSSGLLSESLVPLEISLSSRLVWGNWFWKCSLDLLCVSSYRMGISFSTLFLLFAAVLLVLELWLCCDEVANLCLDVWFVSDLICTFWAWQWNEMPISSESFFLILENFPISFSFLRIPENIEVACCFDVR